MVLRTSLLLKDGIDLLIVQKTLFPRFFNAGVNSFFIDVSQCGSRYFQHNPSVFFGYKEPFGYEVRIEFSSCFMVRMGYIVPNHRFFSCQLANSRHLFYEFIFILKGAQSNAFFFNCQKIIKFSGILSLNSCLIFPSSAHEG